MTEPTKITYFNCNKHTVVLISIFIPSLIITGILVKLSVYGDYYQKQKQQYCNPVNFFWGNNIPCKKFIENVVIDAINNDSFVISQNTEPDINNKPIENNIRPNTNIINYDNLKKTVIDNYLAIIDLIQSFNEFVLLLILKIGGNIINRIFT